MYKMRKNKKLTKPSQNLRRNMTKQERRLWYDFLKMQPEEWHRQKVIGKYIVDFYCAKYNLVIELDGGQHYEKEGIAKDKERDEYLKNLKINVLRFSNTDINKNFRGVCEHVVWYIKNNK